VNEKTKLEAGSTSGDVVIRRLFDYCLLVLINHHHHSGDGGGGGGSSSSRCNVLKCDTTSSK
jgi:hypothetical protein